MNYILIIHQAILLNKLFNDTIIICICIIFAVVLLDGLIKGSPEIMKMNLANLTKNNMKCCHIKDSLKSCHL